MVALSKECAFPVAIAAKVAVIVAPPGLHGWWEALGVPWLSEICSGLGIDKDSLPDMPTEEDVKALSVMVPPDSHHNVVEVLLSLALVQRSISSSTGSSQAPALMYSASARAFLCRVLALLSIPYHELLSAERQFSQQLYDQAQMNERSEELRKEKEHGFGGKWGRIAATAGGAVLGGVAIGLTGGLAAPALLPLLPFLSAGAAPALIGSLFGIAGGGLTGYRVRRRWAGVQEFDFVEISGPGQGDRNKALKQGSAEKAPSLVATLFIPGMQLHSVTESLESTKQCLPLFAEQQQDVYMVSHSPEVMLTTGENLQSWVTTSLLTGAGKEVLQRTALNAVVAAITLPVTIYKATGLAVDNEYIRGRDKARKAGLLLADILREKVQGNRPLILIGSSLGALALFEALLSLSASPPQSSSPKFQKNRGARGQDPLIDTAIFISLPLAPSFTEWSRIRKTVARRVVNGYCKSDFVLASVARLHEVLGGGKVGAISGLTQTSGEVSALGIENVDLSDVMQGHFDLAEKMPDIVRLVDLMK